MNINNKLTRLNAATRHITVAVLDAVGTSICVVVGALGAVVAYHHTTTVPGEWRAAIVGAAAVIAAIVGDGAAQHILGPVHQRLYSARQANEEGTPLPEGLDERLALLVDRDQEHIAARRAYQLDTAGVWLTDPDLWQAHRDGASMHFADGFRLIWHADETPYAGDEFTLAMPDSHLEVIVSGARDLSRYVTDHLAYIEAHDTVPA
ncbi:hypothetical protein [Streptomyces sp. SID3343]|uniref:hypothetical protein n=1 Tax=Streptomyces sp. SID3343 TaxID=2690260 RepID=UPI001368FF0F|nr:hypothetical protein [Streptomyces sp. SID3343]MYW00384.1 hypothetical protein [Streptomyces sp. SID3343]MYW04587.1 hypothetical protein [Streptomyces sp. SID3343]